MCLSSEREHRDNINAAETRQTTIIQLQRARAPVITRNKHTGLGTDPRNSLATRHHLIPGSRVTLPSDEGAGWGDNDLISSVNTQILNCCNARTARFTQQSPAVDIGKQQSSDGIFPIVITDRGGGMSPRPPGECVAISGIVTL